MPFYFSRTEPIVVYCPANTKALRDLLSDTALDIDACAELPPGEYNQHFSAFRERCQNPDFLMCECSTELKISAIRHITGRSINWWIDSIDWTIAAAKATA